ncbi:MAG: hypothetical protein ACC661_00525 [Verrucomicrobiales bacterium]
MIQLSLTEIIVIYLFAILTVLMSVWVLGDMLRKRRQRKALQYKILCAICGTVYEDRSDNALPKCPECGSVNERTRIREI